MRQLVEGLKEFTKNINNFRLDLSSNNLGEEVENWKWLGEGMKWVSNNLQSFTLNLS